MKFVFFAFMLFVILHNDFALILRSKTLFKCKKHAMIFLFKISHHMFLRVLFCIIVTFLNAFTAYFLSLIFPCFLLKNSAFCTKNIIASTVVLFVLHLVLNQLLVLSSTIVLVVLLNFLLLLHSLAI